MNPAKLANIIGGIIGQKMILLPALTVLARFALHLMGFRPKDADVEGILNAVFVVVGILAGVAGKAVDQNRVAINTNAAQLNEVTKEGVVAATVPPVQPIQVTRTPPTTERRS